MVETSQLKIVRRLISEGWTNMAGANHDKFVKEGRDPIIVPRHRTLSPGVARAVARAAGWR